MSILTAGPMPVGSSLRIAESSCPNLSKEIAGSAIANLRSMKSLSFVIAPSCQKCELIIGDRGTGLVTGLSQFVGQVMHDVEFSANAPSR